MALEAGQQYSGPQARYYDAYFTGLPGEVEFYRDQALAAGSPVLEPGCGTGRTLFPVAAAGIDITGVELAPEMLARARARAAALPAQVAPRVRLVAGDMRALPPLDAGPFRLVSLPYRTFQHLLTPADQRAALRGFRQWLSPGGRLALNQFDPTLDLARTIASPPSTSPAVDTEFTDEDTGRRIRVRYLRSYELSAQVLHQELWYETLDGERVAATERGALTLRYSFRYEMEWLLEACGFHVISLWGDFAGGPYPGHGEQVWIAQAA